MTGVEMQEKWNYHDRVSIRISLRRPAGCHSVLFRSIKRVKWNESGVSHLVRSERTDGCKGKHWKGEKGREKYEYHSYKIEMKMVGKCWLEHQLG